MDSKGNIVLIEDDMILSKIIRESLEEEGYTVATGMNGNEGLELIRSVKPTIILLDLLMPQKDGFEVLEILQNDPEVSKIPVVVLTMLNAEENVRRAMELGAIDYIVKSQHPIDEVVEKIKNIVGEHMFRT